MYYNQGQLMNTLLVNFEADFTSNWA